MDGQQSPPARRSASRGQRKRLGDAGERLAADRLRAAGYTITARNYRCPHGELDLIAAEGRCVASTGMMPGARPRATTSRLQALNSFCCTLVPTVAE